MVLNLNLVLEYNTRVQHSSTAHECTLECTPPALTDSIVENYI